MPITNYRTMRLKQIYIITTWARKNIDPSGHKGRKEYMRDAIRKYKEAHRIVKERPANTYKPDSYYRGVEHRSVWTVGQRKKG